MREPSSHSPATTLGLLTEILPLEVFSFLTPFLEDAEAARLLLTAGRFVKRFWLDLRILARLQHQTGCLGRNYLTHRSATCLFSRVAAVKEVQMWWRRRGLLAWVREVVSDARRHSKGLTRANFEYTMTAELRMLVPSCPCCFTREIDVALHYPASASESWWELFVGCRECASVKLDSLQERWAELYAADLRGPRRLTSVWDLLD